MKTAFLSDSGTGLTVQESKELGIFSVPLQVIFDNQSKQDLEEITNEDIISLLKQEKILKTSLPSAGLMDELFESLVKEGYQRIFCVCITKGLSSTADTFELIARQHGLEFIYVNCYTTAYVQQYCITSAKKMYDLGYNIEEIKTACEYIINNSDTFVIPASCDQLIRSGRLSGMAATFAGLLKIKPWLHLNKNTEGKIDALGKTRSQAKLIANTKDVLIEEIRDYFKIHITHVDALAYANQIKEEFAQIFRNIEIHVSNLIAPVAAHTGLGCIAIQYYPKIEMRKNNDTN